MAAETTRTAAPVRHRPKSFTVFAAAFIAGAEAAVGVNRVLDVQLAQRRPQVECEPIFVALRPLAQGAPVTVWDVALKDWPKAMLPSSALRAGDTFEGYVLRHPVREGQPLLAVQLVRSGASTTASTVTTETFTPAVPAAPTAPPSTSTQADPWMPAESMGQPAPAGAPAPSTPVAKASPTTTPPATAEREPQTVPETVAVPKPTVADAATAEPTSPDATSPDAIATDAIATDAVASAPVAAEPVAAEPALVEPTPAEPTPAPTIASTTQPMPPSPTDIDPPSRTQPTPRADSDLDEMNEAVATDVQSMPSVMKANGQPIAPSTRPATGDAGRYLVVPERIALQADTSFTTPRPQPPGPPSTATATPGAAPRSAAQASQASARRGTQPRPQTARGQQSPQQQQQQKTQPQAAARDQKQAAAPQRSWGEMFPNVAAGIEAMGSPWQRSRPTAEQATPTAQPKRR